MITVSKRLRMAFFLLLPCSAAVALQQPVEVNEQAIHLLPDNVRLGQLENGMKVMLVHNPTSTMTGVNIQVHAGAMYETYHTSGMSHMLEHLLFNGTTSRTQEELYDDIDRISAYVNANTAGTYVNYMAVAPAAGFEAAMEIQSDMLFNSTIPPEKFEKERGIVLEELMQARNNPDYRVNTLLHRQIFAGSSLELPVLGTSSTIENMSRDEVWEFYRNFYVPNNMQLSVVGSFDPSSIWELLENYFGSYPASEVIVPDVKELGRLTEESFVSRWKEEEPELHLLFNAPSFADNDYPAFEVLLEVISSSPNPVKTFLIDNGIPVRDVSYQHYPWERFSRLQLACSFSEEVELNRVLPLLDQILNQLAADLDLSEGRIRSIVNTRLTEELRLVERPHNLGMFKGDLLANAGFEYLYRLTHQIQSLDEAELEQVFRRYITGHSRQVIAFHSLPETGTEESSAELNTVRTELPTGGVLIAHDRGGSDLFALHLLFRDRSLHEPQGQEGIVNLLHEMLLTADPDNPADAPELQLQEHGIITKAVDSPWIPFDDYYTSGRFSFLRVECRRGEAETAVRLVSELLYEREFTPGILQSARETILMRLRREKQSPRSLASVEFDRQLLGDHPLTRPVYGTVASIESITLEDVERLRERYFKPTNLIYSSVSALPADQVTAMLNDNLPDLTPTPSPILPPLPLTGETASVRLEAGGEQAFVYAGYITGIDPEDRYPLQLLGRIISDRLAMDLRETRGLAYSVGAWISADNDRAEIGSYIGTRRENLEEVLPVMRESITSFDPASVTADELEVALQGALGRMQMRLLSSIGQAYNLGVGELDGDYLRSLEVTERYRAVTLEEIRSAAAYLGSRPLVEVIAE